MRELSKENIYKNQVDTISQYKMLEYLKKNLNINEFKVYLVDRDTIKVLDKEDKQLFFKYNQDIKEVSYQDKLTEKEKDFEMGL